MAVGARGLRAGRAVIELSMLTKPVERSLKALQVRVSKVRNSFLRLGTGGMLGGTGGFSALAGLRNLFIGSAAAAAVAWPIKLAANLEMAVAQMAVFTGSSESARETLLDLQQLSARAMLSVDSLATNLRVLMARDISPGNSLTILKAISAISAGSEESLMQLTKAMADVNAMGRLQGQELLQFKNTPFNPLLEISRVTGETMEEIVKRQQAGLVSAQEVNQSLLDAVNKGGRFHGMLNAISSTLTGSLNRAFANLKVLMLEFGEPALAPLKKLMGRLNGVLTGLLRIDQATEMSVMRTFIKDNYDTIMAVAKTISMVLAAAAAFISIGLALTIVQIAVGGFLGVFSMIAATLGIILSPIGLLVGGLAALALKFGVAQEWGKTFVDNMQAWFGNLLATARTTFGGITDALMAGDIALAGKVAMAGLYLAWLDGTQNLRMAWIDFKNAFMETTLDIVFGARHLWAKLSTSVRKVWTDLVTAARITGEAIGHGLTASPDDEAANRLHKGRMEGIRQEGDERKAALEQAKKAELALLEAEHVAARGLENERHRRERERAEEARRNAQRELDDAKELARQKAQEAADIQMDEELARLESLGGTAAALGASGMPARGTFDTRMARQMFGGQNEDTSLLRKIEANTRRRLGDAQPGIQVGA